MPIDDEFRARLWLNEPPRPDDERDEYQRDKARVVHSAAFRRLQAKTQVMGVGEGDFHRTRLTHSIEVAQIAEGLVNSLARGAPEEARRWLPTSDLVSAASFAHDLGHPPYGHSGEVALNASMREYGGFEGNAQTLRILARLEKYRPHQGMNPTRRLALAILKYPIPYSHFDPGFHPDKPPKCYYDLEGEVIQKMLSSLFIAEDVERLITEKDGNDKPLHRSFDCRIMECADDIAYAVHDLEDVVARRLVTRPDLNGQLGSVFAEHGGYIGGRLKGLGRDQLLEDLFGPTHIRKSAIGTLVNLFVTSAEVTEDAHFVHPLLRYKVGFQEPVQALLRQLKQATLHLVVQRAEIQQLERRGKRIISSLFQELLSDPEALIPQAAWNSLNPDDTVPRRVCDYIAGMTDPYAERIYHRLFTPGVGSSRDEL